MVRLAPPSIRAGCPRPTLGVPLRRHRSARPSVALLGDLGLRVPFLAYAGALARRRGSRRDLHQRARAAPAPRCARAAGVGRARRPGATSPTAPRSGRASPTGGPTSGCATRSSRCSSRPTSARSHGWPAPSWPIYRRWQRRRHHRAGRLSPTRVGRRPFIVGGLVDSRGRDDRHGLRVRPAGARRAVGRRRRRRRHAQPGPAGRAGRHRRARAQRWAGSGRVPDVGRSGAIIGPILAGVLVDSGSFALAFGVTGLLSLLAAIPWTRARETLPRLAEPDGVPSMRR